MNRLFGMRSRPVANDSGMPLVKKEQPRSSRRVADMQKTGDGFFQRMGNLVRSRRVAPIPVIKPEPTILTTISDRSRSSNKMSFGDDTIYSPFDLESFHSTSRNRTSKRTPLRDNETRGIRNLLQKLDSSPTIPKPTIVKHPTILNDKLLIEHLNGEQFDLSGITEINLNRSVSPHIFKFKIEIIQLLTITLYESNKIDTIVIDDIDYLIPVLVLKLYPQKLQTIKKLILKSKCGTPKPITDEVIFDLLNMIEKMNALEELEFSNFVMDVSKFKITLMDFFRRIVGLNKLKHITFECNVFTDNVKEGEFDDFHGKYLSTDGVRRTKLDRISLIIEWMIKNPVRNIDFDLNAYTAYIHSNFWKTYIQQQTKERTKISNRRRNLQKISDVKFDDFLNNKEEVKRWLIWLIKNEGDIRETGDIVERLRIVIKYFKYNKDSIVNFFEENQELQMSIIIEFNTIVATYKPRPNDEYNRIITEIIGDKLVKSIGGRRVPKKTPKQPKVSLKAPKKTPKQPKVSLKAPKKTPKQPKVALKAPKKPSKQPTKPPKVARKANKKN